MTTFKGKAEKLTWAAARAAVQAVNPDFAAIIDELSPDDSHWLVRAEYPYGSQVLKQALFMLPNNNGDIVPITDDSIDKTIQAGLRYNMDSNPVSLVLSNSFELFYPLQDRIISSSGFIKPGIAFGAFHLLGKNKSEHPKFLWDMTAGARSTFMLPKISEALKHKKMEKTLGISATLPRNLMQHFDVFSQIANSPQATKDPWTAEILFFSEAWFKHLDQKSWEKFYYNFYKGWWSDSEYWRNLPFWSLIFSLVLNEYEARPNAYIMDTAKYLLSMGVGAFCGFGPALNTMAGPYDLIQRVYNDVYDIRHYPPVIIQPQNFKLFDANAKPTYYSLQFPNALEFKPSTRSRTSIISDLHEIRMLMKRYEREFLTNKFNIEGTSFAQLFNVAQYDYFHKANELHDGMRDSGEMAEDANLRTTVDGQVHDAFPASCLFSKGCIRINALTSQ
jgi:hypothetical protein